MKEQVPVEKLARGMFVAELDRPWLETPFLIQGFVIESSEQIEDLRRCCKFVHVERSLSLGDQFRPDPTEKVARPASRPTAKPQVHGRGDPAPKPGIGTSLRNIFRALFASAPEVELPTSTRSADGRRATTSTVERDTQSAPKPKIRVRLSPHERGISSEERDYLEKVIDPDASVRVYTEKEIAARDSFIKRLLRLFGLGEKPPQKSAVRVTRQDDRPVYEDKTTIEDELPMAKEAHEKVELVVQEVISDLNKNKELDLEKVGDAVGWMVQSVVRNPDGMIWLARLKSVDAYTYDHGLNTAIYLIAFGRHLGLPEDQLQVIGTVGLMQDVGKLRLPRALLDKREKLSPAELKVFQSHVAHSLDIIRTSKDATEALLAVVSEHHERIDGSGYPEGLVGDQISLLGGMAGLVDTYAAMISARPYSQPVSVQQALHELYSKRNHDFKAELVEEFIQCVGVFPVGSLVELNTSEVAVVVSQNRSRRLKPRVMLVLDSSRQPFASPIMHDLIYDPPTPAGEPYRIVRGLQAGVYDYDPKQTLDALMEAA